MKFIIFLQNCLSLNVKRNFKEEEEEKCEKGKVENPEYKPLVFLTQNTKENISSVFKLGLFSFTI